MRREKLSSLCKISNGYAFKSDDYTSHGYRVMRITNVQKGAVVDDDPKFVPDDIANKANNFKLFTGDILVSLTGNVGRVGRVKTQHLPAVLNQRVGLIRPTSNEINDKYLFQYLNSDQFEREAIQNSNGVAQLNLSSKWIENHEIPLPLLDDQIRIAHLLGKVEGLIAQRKQHLQQLDDLLKSVFLEMFGDPVRNEKGWDTGLIVDFCDVKGGKRIPKGDSLVNQNTGFPYIKAGNIKNGEVTLNDLEYVTPDVRKLISRYTVDEGDVCITVVGANIGDVGVVPTTLHKASLTENANKLLIKDKRKLNNHYLANYLMSGYVQQQIASSIRAAGVPKLAIFRIEQMLLLVPPIDEQVKFEKIKNQIKKLASRHQQSLSDLEALYSALSQQAFKGELDLSRVPMPSITPEEEKIETAVSIQASIEQAQAIHLPNIDDLIAALGSPDTRKDVFAQWLEAYRNQLGSTPFSVQQFMETARSQLAEGHPDSDFELGTNDREHIKAWVFEALAAGRLMQSFDDVGNRIELKTRTKKKAA
jgi:type I restriction enzyme S subunit